MDAKTFTSPLKKLVRFFQESRDGWKAKCQAAKRAHKRESNQARAVEKSRDHWKELARQREEEIRALRAQLSEELSEDKNAANGACLAGSGGARGT